MNSNDMILVRKRSESTSGNNKCPNMQNNKNEKFRVKFQANLTCG